ncbi:histidine phosphatase family protein [Lachnospiraceae bacterium C1.1]|nr:histidine phosphatase family protein [Lachnospiraceae bacterium C1.1]
MKLLIIRHGDPDYVNDTLTEKGWKEAELLSDMLENYNIKDIYVSPLGRAKDTASLTLKKLNKEEVICDWLREFNLKLINRPDVSDKRKIPWDWLPEDLAKRPWLYDKKEWLNDEIIKEGEVDKEYISVIEEFDKLLEKHGYKRDGDFYKVIKPNNDTIAFFCHFGLESVLLSHLMNVSPFALWHHTCAAPTSVTTVRTEERREGKALFRISSFGDISHLYARHEIESESARFCECYGNTEERHD